MQAPPLFPPNSPQLTPEQARRTRDLQAHYAAANAAVKKTREADRNRIAERDRAKGKAR